MNGQIQAIEYRAETDRLNVFLDDQKQAYADYEQYKIDFGKTAADKRFKNEMDLSISYMEDLKMRQQDLLRNGEFNLTGPEKERLKEIQDRIKAVADAEQTAQDELVKEFMAYSEKRKAMIEKGNADIKNLEGDPVAQANRKKKLDEDVKDLDFANLKKLESYEALFNGIDQLSERSALKQLEFARRELDKDILSGQIKDPVEIAKIKAKFDELEKTIRSGSGQALKDLGAEVVNIASEAGLATKAFGQMLNVLGNVVDKVGDIKAGIKAFELAKAKGNGLGQLTAGLGIFGAGMSIFNSIFKMFDKSAQREAQQALALQQQTRQQDALNNALQRQVELLDQVYGTDRIAKYEEVRKQADENAARAQEELAKKYKITDNARTNSYLEQINNGVAPNKISGGSAWEILDFYNKFNKGAFSQIGDVSKMTIEQLMQLRDGGPIDEGSQKLLDNLIEARKTAQDIANRLAAELTGTSIDKLASDFISVLTDGTKDFGGTFEETIRNAILNGLKGDLIKEQLQDFYKNFSEYSKDGLTETEIEALRKEYIAAGEAGKKRLQELEKISGQSLTGTTSDSNTLKGRIESITSNQADKLEGVLRGVQGGVLKTNTILLDHTSWMAKTYLVVSGSLSELVKITANTQRTADNTESLKRLERVESALISIDKKMDKGSNSLNGTGRTGG